MVRKIIQRVNFAYMFGQVALAVGWMAAKWTTIRFKTWVYDCMSFKQRQCFKRFVTNLTWMNRFIVYSVLVCYQSAFDSKHWTAFFTPSMYKKKKKYYSLLYLSRWYKNGFLPVCFLFVSMEIIFWDVWAPFGVGPITF